MGLLTYSKRKLGLQSVPQNMSSSSEPEDDSIPRPNLKRKQSVISSRRTSAESNAPYLKKQKSLKQMKLDFGNKGNIKTCRTCEMQYVPADCSDAELHQKFHDGFLEAQNGVKLTKSLLEKLKKNCRTVYDDTEYGTSVFIATRKAPQAVRDMSTHVLKVLEKELGAVPIDEKELWSDKHNYALYLSVKKDRCIGALLCTVLTEEHRVIKIEDPDLAVAPSLPPLAFSDSEPDTAAWSTSVEHQLNDITDSEETPRLEPTSSDNGEQTEATDYRLSGTTLRETEPNFVRLGFERVWTASKYRRQNIALALCNVAAASFHFGKDSKKDRCAFSQPTDMGKKLAQRFFGKPYGWHIYVSNCT